MRRRRFLAAAMGTVAMARPVLGAKARPRPVSYPRVVRLTSDREFQDARPCFSPDGSTILFMRNRIIPGRTAQTGPSEFWTVPALGGVAERFAAVDSVQLTRPDWSWHRDAYEIAFEAVRNGRQSIWLMDVATRRCELVLGGLTTENRLYSYPSWYPGGRFLSVTNYWSEGDDPESRQRLMLVSLDGRTRALTNPAVIWPGMSSVYPGPSCGDDVSPPIAFAGERPTPAGYNQDDNQIWIRHSDGRVAPVDGQQARAPWWSPDGRLLALESNRLTGGNYQIFVQSPYHPRQIRPITPPTMKVQHAKWSPDGRLITFAYAIDSVAQGIAVAYLGG
jgi:Tol biopolymer transport system component